MPLRNYNFDNIRKRDTYAAGSPVDVPVDVPAPLSDFVADHSASHENGGSDEIDVTGLSGLLADPQTPLAHTHDVGDIDSGSEVAGRVMKSDGAGGASWEEDAGGTLQWWPLVDGAEPAGLISDGAGNLVRVAIAIA